jgi:general secretion pathway protein A
MYLTYYELKDEPFRLTPDPRYLHLSAPHQAALTVLLEGILYRKGLVMITGPIGTGKTTLVHTALQMLVDYSKQKVPIKSALLFNPTLTRDEFLEMMLDEFEVTCASTSKPRRLAALHEMLLEAQREGGTAVLFIDEAHLLSPEVLEEIRLLGNADLHREKLLQIVLSGQPELIGMMNRPELSALRQRISARAHLRPLSLPEVCSYIVERLKLAGHQGMSPFPSGTVEAIHQYASGVPRLTNLICDACLSLGFRTKRRTIQLDMVEEVAISLGLLEPVKVVALERKAIPAPVPSVSGMQRSIVDTLIEAMKQNRSAALE